MPYLNRKKVNPEEISPEKHKFVGMFRPPNGKSTIAFSYSLWLQGHFDEPMYKTIKSSKSDEEEQVSSFVSFDDILIDTKDLVGVRRVHEPIGMFLHKPAHYVYLTYIREGKEITRKMPFWLDLAAESFFKKVKVFVSKSKQGPKELKVDGLLPEWTLAAAQEIINKYFRFFYAPLQELEKKLTRDYVAAQIYKHYSNRE